MPALRIKYPALGVITHVLRSERVTLGRAADNSIQIPHASISNHHAEIISLDGYVRLRDLGSTNHSFLNGEQITECELAHGCRIAFGTIECEYDAHATTTARPPDPLALAAAPPQLAFLENENRELRAHVTSLQRRFDILGSARITAGQADRTPSGLYTDAVRGLTGERDELRQQAAGLRMEIGRLREELTVTARERDAARQAAAGMQAERTQLQLELQQAELRIERLRSELIIANEAQAAPRLLPPARPPVAPPPVRPSGTTMVPPPAPPARPLPPAPPTAVVPATPAPVTLAEVSQPTLPDALPPALPIAETTTLAPAHAPAPSISLPSRRSSDPQLLPTHIGKLRERITELAVAPSDRTLLRDAHAETQLVLALAPAASAHPLHRIAIRVDSLLASLEKNERLPAASTLRTLRHAAELLERLLDPAIAAAASELPTAQILAIDDDSDLLATITASLGSGGLEVSGCVSAEAGMIAIEALRFDTIIADIGLPGINGTDFCAHARSRPAYRRTPILFLTGADTLDKRAATSLSGGTEFIAKPFDSAELSLKVESWSLKHQLHLV